MGIRDPYAENFLAPLGKLVLAVAHAEGKAGELIVLKNHRAGFVSSAWATSGKQLYSELRRCYAEPEFQKICDELASLTPKRNHLLHGEWNFTSTEKAYVFNRHHLKQEDAPTYVGDSVSPEDVEALAEAYAAFERSLGDYIREALGYAT